jgi:hypothetical protein
VVFRIRIDKAAAPKFAKNLAGVGERFEKALTAAANMAASMIQEKARADIAGSGNFSGDWVSGLHVKVEGEGLKNMRISMYHDKPEAEIFAKGGEIHGNPLLWIPLSGTDAEGTQAKDYHDGLFSAVSRAGNPLLFSISDKMPKYYGIESVTIPQKWHLDEIQKSVMANFRQLFDTAFKAKAK